MKQTMFASLDKPCLVTTANQAPKNEVASEWEYFDVFNKIDKLHRKYVPGITFSCPSRVKKWVEAANSVLAMCEAEGIDPDTWLSAQVVLLSQYLKAGGRFFPGSLLGKNAVIRYEKYRERNKRHTRNSKARNEEDDGELLLAEVSLGEYVVANACEDEDGYDITESLFPKWSPDNAKRAELRPRALIQVLGVVNHNLPYCVRLKRDFRWSEISAFVNIIQAR